MSRSKILALALFLADTVSPSQAQPAGTPTNKGEYLARAGDCVSCHSVRGGKAFAGGLAMGTPMGTIYTTNITPDPETGIGGYSLADFDRAVRSGVAKDGHNLYPAIALSILRQDHRRGYPGAVCVLHARRAGGETTEQAERNSLVFEPALAVGNLECGFRA
jgi:hypothetical protein